MKKIPYLMVVGALVGAGQVGCGSGDAGGTGGSGALGGNHASGGKGGLAGSSGAAGNGAAGSSATGGNTATGGNSGAAGSTTPGACGQVEPCGGEVGGVWDATSGCINNSAFMLSIQKQLTAGCGLVAVISSGDVTTGSITFSKATMTYSTNFTETITIQFNIPMACLTGQTCAQYASSLLQQSSTLAATCTGTTTCNCTYTSQLVSNESGTYTTSQAAVTLTSTLGTSTVSDYCVQGTTLHLVDIDNTMSTGPNGQATIDDDTVFTKE